LVKRPQILEKRGELRIAVKQIMFFPVKNAQAREFVFLVSQLKIALETYAIPLDHGFERLDLLENFDQFFQLIAFDAPVFPPADNHRAVLHAQSGQGVFHLLI